MALNTDFKVKDSLYVGNSACFVSQTNTPVILSAGSSLFDIFLQEGEVATNCNLTDGIGIGDFTYDGSAAVSISADFTEVVRTSTDQTIGGTKSFSGTIDATTPSAGGAILSGGTDLATIFTTCVGDITNVSATGGLSGGGSSGSVSVGIDSGTLTPYQEAKDWVDTYGNNVVLSGSSGSQGTLTLTDVDNTTLDIDLGLQTGDNVQFTNICGTGTLDIDGNADFNGQILSGGNDLFDIFSEGDITSVTAGTGLSGGGSSGDVTLAINASTWACFSCQGTFNTATGGLSSSGGNVGIDAATAANFSCQGIVTGIDAGTAITVADNGTATPQVGVTAACNNAWNAAYDTITSSAQGEFTITPIVGSPDTVDLGLQTGDSPVFLGLSAITLSGDGQAITGVTATPIFPSTACTTIKSTDKFFINDDAGGATSGNKNITYANLLCDLAGGEGIVVTGSDSLCVAGAAGLSNNTLTKWDNSNNCFINSIATDNGTTFTVAGSATIQGDLTVQGNLTCLDTLVSITSAIEICNHGTGPALYAEQTGANCVIACFVDSEGGSVVIDDGGNLDINSGDLTVDGNTTLGNAATDIVTVNACGITFGNSLAGGTTNDVVILDGSDVTRCRAIDSRVWGSSLVDGSGTANYIPIWSDGNSIGISSLSSTGGLTTIGEDVAVNGDVSVNAGNAFDVYATGNSIYSSEKTFTATVGTGGTTVATFAKSGFDAGKYVVTLINGVNKTVFEVLVTYNGTSSFGTVYGIVDAQAASQLDTIDVSNASSTIDLVITSASASTTAIIHGKAFY